MNLEGTLSVLAIFGIACFITIMAQKLSSRSLSSLTLKAPLELVPMDIVVHKVCSLCRGHGRKSLAVDPREFTHYEDKKLIFEDFPVCPECKGSGRNLFLQISTGPCFLGGALSQDTFTSQKQQPGVLALEPNNPDSLSEKSPPAEAQIETSSTPSNPS